MRIGEVAAQAAVNIQTLRYYERRGLLAAPRRSAAGHRAYPADTVRVVRFIKQAQGLGFTLQDVEELLRLSRGGRGTCQAVRGVATIKVAELDEKIASLERMRASLRKLVATCDRPRARRECPLLASLGGELT